MLNPFSFISKFIRSDNQKQLDRINEIVNKVNQIEESIKNLKNAWIFKVFCYPTPVPKSSQNVSKTSQVKLKLTILAPSWPTLALS